ncbi:MAG TPA: asparagine synthase (glutamine-hydrolyzing) [Vicinamibacterales bacterium]|jgi:asparagine synthase (glutamine-hydrolysing)|nr:asparagine synthase (glutamine-hydrolyzing) [Vicinamibacterales bacterium]
MCGIVGSYRPEGGECRGDIIARMRDRMSHRGPDGTGLWCSPDRRCAFGHRRLSIIDLSSAASQPMANADGTVVVTYNGEIYNHQDVRRELTALGKYVWTTDHSDTEVLLHAYEEWGLDCVKRFYGMFAIGIYDARNAGRPALHLVRDRVGIKPLYFTRTRAGEWLFASEIRALFAHPDLTPEMDRTAFWHYLTFIVTPAPLTLFRGIFKLPAGHTLTIDHTGRATARQYWDCRPDTADTLRESDLSEPEAVAELTRLLKQSIARRMVSDVPFGVLLSGGVDSSLNVALMSELMSRPVTTFTIGYEGKDDYNEFDYARQISRRYGTDHHETRIDRDEMQQFLPLLVRLQDEPIADNVCIPLFFLAQLVRRSGTTVVQVGEGADENFLGYWWCEHYRKKYTDVYAPARRRPSRWRRLFASAKARTPGISGEDLEIVTRAERGEELFWGGAVCWWGEMRARLTPDPTPYCQKIECPVEGLVPDAMRRLDSHAVVDHYIGELTGHLTDPEVLHKIPYMEMKLRLPEHLLMRVDKLTMAHAVEARVPFLDHDVVEFATRLPSSYKLRDGVGKAVLKHAAAPYLDEAIINRRKQGFGAPMEEWFREGDFGSRCLAAFHRSALTRDGFFDAGYFTDLLEGQMQGRGGYSFQLWTVMNAVLWHASWIEGREDCL